MSLADLIGSAAVEADDSESESDSDSLADLGEWFTASISLRNSITAFISLGNFKCTNFFFVVAVNGSESDATDDEESKEESEEESDADDEDLPHLGKQLIHHIYFISQI